MVPAAYHLAANYMHRCNTKYNTHKKTELRDIYKAIVKLSKQSPLYLFHLSDEKQVFALSLKDSALSLSNTLKEFCNTDSESVFSFKKAVSTKEDCVMPAITGTEYENLPEEFYIQIDRLAARQVNCGIPVTSYIRGLKAGNYHFTVDTDKSTHEYQFPVVENSTNIENLNKIKEFINHSDLPIHAGIEYNKKDDTCLIVLSSESTGTNGKLSFSFKDAEPDAKRRGLVEYFGLDQVKTYPCNSIFSINGKQEESDSNLFRYQKILNINLLKPTTEPAYIHYTPDTDMITDLIHNLADSYNQFIKTISNYDGKNSRSSLLLNEFNYILKDYKTELECCGLTFDEYSYMLINEPVMLTSATDGTIEKLFNDINGFMPAFQNKLKQIQLDPMQYLDKKIVTYPNYGKAPFPNPYLTSMYSGMFYNYYC